MAHLDVKQRTPFKKSFSPARRHCLHLGSIIFAMIPYEFTNFYEYYKWCGWILVQLVIIRLPASPVKASLGDAGGPKPIVINRHK
jgi:hypothetical protein